MGLRPARASQQDPISTSTQGNAKMINLSVLGLQPSILPPSPRPYLTGMQETPHCEDMSLGVDCMELLGSDTWSLGTVLEHGGHGPTLTSSHLPSAVKLIKLKPDQGRHRGH